MEKWFEVTITERLYDVVDTTLFVHVVVRQPNVSSCEETVANSIHFPVEVIGANKRPVVVLEILDLSR